MLESVQSHCYHVVQDNGLVPIVEPEMTLGEGDYTIEDTSYWSERVLTHVFRHLNEHDVMLEGILMKPSMCLPGQPHASSYCKTLVETLLQFSISYHTVGCYTGACSGGMCLRYQEQR